MSAVITAVDPEAFQGPSVLVRWERPDSGEEWVLFSDVAALPRSCTHPSKSYAVLTQAILSMVEFRHGIECTNLDADQRTEALFALDEMRRNLETLRAAVLGGDDIEALVELLRHLLRLDDAVAKLPSTESLGDLRPAVSLLISKIEML